MSKGKEQVGSRFLGWSIVLALTCLGAFWVLLPPVPDHFRSSPQLKLDLPPPIPKPLPLPETKVRFENKPKWVKADGSDLRSSSRRYSKKPSSTQTAAKHDAEELLNAAIQLVDRGEWQEAEKKLLEIVKQDPKNEGALVELAMINLLDKKDPMQALPYMEGALRANADNESMVTELLSIYSNQGRSQEAIDFLKELGKENPESPALDYGLAQAMMQAGKPEQAVDYLQRSIEQKSGRERDHLVEQLGDTYAELGQTDQALEAWREVLERKKAHMESFPEHKEYMQEQFDHIRLKYVSGLLDSDNLQEADEILKQLEQNAPKDEWVISMRRAWKDKSNL